MKNTMLALAAMTAVVSMSAQAAPPVVQGTVATLEAVLSKPGLTLTNVVGQLPNIANDAVAGVANVANSLPPSLLGTSPQQTTFQTVIVPIPGPDFLNVTLANIGGGAAINVRGAGPVVVTFITAP